MTRYERIKANLEDAKRVYLDTLRRNDSAGQRKWCNRVQQLKHALEEAEQYETKKLRDMLPAEVMRQERMAESIAAIHLAMDCLVEITMDFQDKLKRHDLYASELCGKVDKIRKYADDLLGDVCKLGNDSLTHFITEDCELVDDMCKLVYDYVDTRLKG